MSLHEVPLPGHETAYAICFWQTTGLALAVKYQDHIPLMYRVLVPLCLTAAVFVFTTIFVTVDIDRNLLFVITLFSCMIVGVSNAMLSGGLFGLCGNFPPRYTGALMGGQGLAGLAVSIASISTTWAGSPIDMCSDDDADDGDDDGSCEDSTDYSALVFFCITCVVMGTCVFSFLALMALPFTHHYQEKSRADRARGPSVTSVDDDTLAKTLIQRLTNTSQDADEGGPLVDTYGLDNSSSSLTASAMNDKQAVDHTVHNHQPETISKAKIMKIFGQIKPAALSAWLSYLVTLGLFPSITVLIESQHQCGENATRFNNDLFIPFMFLMFNAFDFFGRLYAGVNHHGITPENILYFVCTRIIFFPLFLFCNVTGSQLPVLFKSDAWPIGFMALFAFSNGYLSTLAMMFGPTMVSARNSALAGTIMIFSLTLGLMSGAASSFLALFISQGSI